jgi:PAS domain S-box-containing protein
MAETTTASDWTGRDLLKDAAYVVVGALGYAVLAYLCVEFPSAYGQVTPIWLSNGFGVAGLLSTRGRHWPALLLGCLVGGLAAGAHVGDPVGINIVLVSCNVLQIFICAWGVRRFAGDEVDLGQPRDMIVFALVCGLAGPLLTSAVAASLHTALRGGHLLANIATWTMGDILGMMTITPCMLALVRARDYLRQRPLSISGVASLALLLAVTIAVFAQSRYPLLFVVPPMMLLVAWRLEVLGAALSATLVAIVAVLFTLAGHGPIALMRHGSQGQAIVLQLFLAVAIFISLPVASIERRRRQMLRNMTEANACVARSEARYRLLAETAQDMIIHSDIEGVVQYASPACLAVTGYAPEELVGREGMTIVHPDDVARVRAAVEAQLSALDQNRIEYRALRKDGGEIWLESRPALLRDPVTGRATGIIDIVRDVTEQHEREVELREARRVAEAAAGTKARIPGQHDPRAAHAADGGAGLLAPGRREPDLSDDSRVMVGRIMSAGEALLSTINDILDFSKLEDGHVEIRLQPICAGLLGEAVELLSLQAGEKRPAAGPGVDPGMPARVLIDPERVRQLVLNLIGNAVKFTEAGSVTVALRPSADGAAMVCRSPTPDRASRPRTSSAVHALLAGRRRRSAWRHGPGPGDLQGPGRRHGRRDRRGARRARALASGSRCRCRR